jgi:hypothetical protein
VPQEKQPTISIRRNLVVAYQELTLAEIRFQRTLLAGATSPPNINQMFTNRSRLHRQSAYFDIVATIARRLK